MSDDEQLEIEAARAREADPAFARWAAGYGVIRHAARTQLRIRALTERLATRACGDGPGPLDVLHALDRVASAGMWLVVHQTYAARVHLDGRALARDEFKVQPEGHTGGSLNMVPAYAAYLAANAISGVTRGWLMGQGHCVAAIDSLNLLVGNMSAAHAERYELSDAGLSRYVGDFYAYRLGRDGEPESPLGSHVNVHTAGGVSEGGYLGFAELQYPHIPLPGERLVVFLSDGAFEEQRGSDWAPRWWRAEDTGWVTPIMISNGRRIDQRTTMAQQGGVSWFVRHLELNGFDPIVFDGRDPAAFVWAILEMEARLGRAVQEIHAGRASYPVALPYGIAVAPKGAGFVGEGTNRAHNLPLGANPHEDPDAAEAFRQGAQKLWVPLDDLGASIETLSQHARSQRPRERDHPMADRRVALRKSPELPYAVIDPERRAAGPAQWAFSSPMRAVDASFVATVRANPHLRPRVGNPDEMRSNRLDQTLEALRFRVTDPEPGLPESIDGAVITALNEEAVLAAALANKAGLNLVHTYEAFGSRMFGALRQEVIFSSQCRAAGRPPGWLSVPLLLTSHTWENGKNEQSHQDPSLAESMLAEAYHVSRVFFPPDANAAAALMDLVYRSHGEIWSMVVPKAEGIPNLFTRDEAYELAERGLARLRWAGLRATNPSLVLAAVGAYQLREALRMSQRLTTRDVAHSIVCVQEPGRLRSPTCRGEEALHVDLVAADRHLPAHVPRLFLTHTRPGAITGLLGPLHTGRKTAALGYSNRGGTLDTDTLLYVNEASWAHGLFRAAELLQMRPSELLEDDELGALFGTRSPHGVVVPPARR